jgi:hypothetical protein
MNERKYFLAVKKRIYGPFTEEQVREALYEGLVTYRNYIWREDFKIWHTVGDLPEFTNRFEDTPPPIDLKKYEKTVTSEKEWIVFDRGKVKGPYSLDELYDLINVKVLRRSTPAYRKGMQDWQLFIFLDEFIDFFSKDAPAHFNQELNTERRYDNFRYSNLALSRKTKLRIFELTLIIVLIIALDIITEHSVFSKKTESLFLDNSAKNLAISSETKLCIWGGFDGAKYLNDGFCSNTSDVELFRIEKEKAPSPRDDHTAIYKNNQLCVWGGFNGKSYLNDGACYNLKKRKWSEIKQKLTITPRANHSAITTESGLCIWGGIGWDNAKGENIPLNSGACYNVENASWKGMTTINAPTPRFNHTAIWTGNSMCIWGGWSGKTNLFLNTGACYNMKRNKWTPIKIEGAPIARYNHLAVWSGKEMCIWGGDNGTYLQTGGCYNPETKKWAKIAEENAPPKRPNQVALWKNNRMCVWGKLASQSIRKCYERNKNTWSSTNTN